MKYLLLWLLLSAGLYGQIGTTEGRRIPRPAAIEETSIFEEKDQRIVNSSLDNDGNEDCETVKRWKEESSLQYLRTHEDRLCFGTIRQSDEFAQPVRVKAMKKKWVQATGPAERKDEYFREYVRAIPLALILYIEFSGDSASVYTYTKGDNREQYLSVTFTGKEMVRTTDIVRGVLTFPVTPTQRERVQKFCEKNGIMYCNGDLPFEKFMEGLCRLPELGYEAAAIRAFDRLFTTDPIALAMLVRFNKEKSGIFLAYAQYHYPEKVRELQNARMLP